MKSLTLLLDKSVFRLVSIMAQLLLLSAVIASFHQVVSRFVFESPADWTEVWTRCAIIWVVLLGLVLACRQGAMLKVEMLENALNEKHKRWLSTLVMIITSTFLGILTWVGCMAAYRFRFQTIAGLEFSIAWIYAAIPIGSFLALIAVIVHWSQGSAESNDEIAPL
ncbi:TRAP transporter small permease [Advenella sp. RU8]|uniref:TRAP transporter small permease n=1 Tax=Advenella sp. RU8 TaxID=3399575 RepID=UPI003AAD8C2F